MRRFSTLKLSLMVGFILFLPHTSFASGMLDPSILAKVPIIDEGRIKPLETFAEVHLLAFYGKRSLPDTNAMEWLMELILSPQTAYEKKVFNIRSDDVVAALNLERRDKHKYTFREVSTSLQGIMETVNKLHTKQREERTPTQNQLVELHIKMLRFYEVSRSLSLVFPLFEISSEPLAKDLGLTTGRYSYLEMLRLRKGILDEIKRIKGKEFATLNEKQQNLAKLAYMFEHLQEDGHSQAFRIVPPQWKDSSDEWFSPWAVVQTGQGSPSSMKYFKLWQSLAHAYQNQDLDEWDATTKEILKFSQTFSQKAISTSYLTLEHHYNQWKLFTKSLAFYVLAFLLLAFSWIVWPEKLRKASFVSLAIGGGFHLVGVVMRIFIMGRPPVSTLYESIIFVGLVAVIFGLILERLRRNGLGILIATVVGAALHFISLSYASEGDTMGMLVAVLNTNFWLATHVVTITIGYGCCLVGGIVGHVYLIFKIFKPHDEEKLAELYQNMIGISLFSLFFSLFGTILGGIWADQSWGRFWGWDPKENGALLIVLWLLWLLHGRIAEQIHGSGFALGMVITNIIVALAWFGVNLLNVGLHSYGFTENIALNLALFCGLELLFGLGTYGWIKKSTHPS